MIQYTTENEMLHEYVTPFIDKIAQQTNALCQYINTLEDIQAFTQRHVYAVWDFKCLVEILKKRIDPEQYPSAARLINGIYLEEVQDNIGERSFAPHKKILSHYELYLIAMQQIGADTSRIKFFVQMAEQYGISHALREINLSKSVENFVNTTFSFFDKPLPTLAAAFVYGREAITSKMFVPLIKRLSINSKDTERLAALNFYFNRHVALDSNTHLPQAMAMLASLCKTEDDWVMAKSGAKKALEARQQFLLGCLLPATFA